MDITEQIKIYHYRMACHKGLDLWNIGSKLKLYRLYKVTSHNGLDLWNVRTKLKICRLYQMAYHKGLDLWNIGSQLKLYGLYKVTSHIELDHSLGHFCIYKCHVSFYWPPIFMSSLKPSWNKNYMYLTQETKIWCIMVSSSDEPEPEFSS